MKKKWQAALLLLICLCLTACGAMSGGSAAQEAMAEPSYATEEAAEMDEYETGSYNGLMDNAASSEAKPAEEPAAADDGTQEEPDVQADPAAKDQKLVYQADLSIQTLEFDSTMTAIKSSVKDHGGVIEYESLSDSDYRWYYYEESRTGRMYAHLTVRIPSARYEDFVASLEGTGGKIISKSQNVVNITRRYNDQSILIESLETQERRLMEMMEAAESVEDMIAIESRLSEVQTELNQARTALASMDTDVAYSTVNLDVEEVIRYENTVQPRTFGERIAQALEGSKDNFLDFCQEAVIFLIYAAPILVLLLIVFLVLRAIFRALRGKRKAKAARRGKTPAVHPAPAEEAAPAAAPEETGSGEDHA